VTLPTDTQSVERADATLNIEARHHDHRNGAAVTLRLVPTPTERPNSRGSAESVAEVGLDRDGDRSPLWKNDDGDDSNDDADNRRSRRRPRLPQCNPVAVHFSFANEVLPLLPTEGEVRFITISPPDGVKLESLFKAVLRVLDDWDCDHFTVVARGKRNGHRHIHSVAHIREPTALYVMFATLLRTFGVNPDAFKAELLYGYRNGRRDKRLTTDFANLSEYVTGPNQGAPVHLLPFTSAARGIFHGPWVRLTRVLKAAPVTVQACEGCGKALVGGRRHRRACDGTCRQRKRRRSTKAKSTAWRLRLGNAYARRWRLFFGNDP
jgi:hypothetical protein